jgi:nucleotide-binding universal stress UspA family protein
MAERKKGRTILIALDGSPAAQAASGVAIQIAQSQGFSVRGLYVVDEALALDTYTNPEAELDGIPSLISRAELITQFRSQGEMALQWLEAHSRAAGVAVSVDLLAGGVMELVLREAAQARLLAMGRRGHGHAGDPTRLGSNFRAIAHRTRLPMAVGGDEERSVQRLLLAYDGSRHAKRALEWAARLQHTLPVEVLVLAVQEQGVQPVEQWLEEARLHLDHGEPGSCRCLRRTGQPGIEIAAAADENEVDLVVMGRYRHQVPIEWLVGSTVDQVLRDTQLPVLIV